MFIYTIKIKKTTIMQELINKLEFMKGEFQKRQDAEIIGTIEFYHYFGIVQGYEFSINEIKKSML